MTTIDSRGSLAPTVPSLAPAAASDLDLGPDLVPDLARDVARAVLRDRAGEPATGPAPAPARAPSPPTRRAGNRTLRVAMIGQRGLPARAGGVERHVEEVATRLAARGHDVTVFCRPSYGERCTHSYHGVRLASLPTIRAAGGEALVHSGLSTLVSLRENFDVVHYHALGPGLFSPVARALAGAAVVQTVHGLDDQRAKWGATARRVLRTGRLFSAHVPDEVVVVSRALGEHYRDSLGRCTTYIGNGVPAMAAPDPGFLRTLGLEAGRYVVFVGRMVPEKDPLGLVEAYRDVRSEERLVLVGDSSHTDAYMAQLRQAAASDPRVLLVGFQYDERLAALLCGARLFVQPSTLEGLPISLLEAASVGVPVLASDIAPHLEVLQERGPGRSTFRAGDRAALTAALTEVLATPDEVLRAGAQRLRVDACARYDWDVATDLLEDVYHRAVARRRGEAASARPEARELVGS